MVSTEVSQETTAGLARRHWWLGVAALVWFVLYRVNKPFWDWLVFDVAGAESGSRFGESVWFFCYDVTKIALLLTGVIFVVTVLRSFMSVERTRALLGGRREGAGNVAAAGLGVVTPFCSCSAVPAFIGFVAAGVPLGVTLSFLIASPLVNEVAIVLLLAFWLEDHCFVHSRWHDRGCRSGISAWSASSRAMGRAVRIRNPLAGQGDRPCRRSQLG